MYITILRILFSHSTLRVIYVYKKGASLQVPVCTLTNYIYEVFVIFFVVGLRVLLYAYS